MRTEPEHSTRWEHMWTHHNRGVVWDTAVSKWVGGQEWAEEERGSKNNEKANNSKQTMLGNLKLLVAHVKKKIFFKKKKKNKVEQARNHGNHCRKTGR